MNTEDNAKEKRRLWIAENSPDVHWAFRGVMPFRLFYEAQDDYIAGNFLSSIASAASFLEQSLAAEFQSIGQEDVARESLPKLAETARKIGWLLTEDEAELKRVWGLRKPVTHYRKTGHPTRIEYRQFTESKPIEEILEGDARSILATMFYLAVNRKGFGIWSGQIPKTYVRGRQARTLSSV